MDDLTNTKPDLKVSGAENQFPKVRLVAPTGHTFVILALEIDHRPPLFAFWESRAKKQAIQALKAFSTDLAGLVDLSIFKAVLAPPGRGEYLKQRLEIPIARYDLVMLLELETTAAAQTLQSSTAWQTLLADLKPLALNTLELQASNPRQIGPVDHTRQGIFLFNFFYADDLAQNLGIWEYTAGWFVKQTGLDNSCLMAPETDSIYTVINHCRWDSLWHILPSILFKPSFKSYVTANFNANKTAPIPILYKLA
ncbi:MAG: hypothetical protein V3V13_07425 [Paracoccaceae bacterium]